MSRKEERLQPALLGLLRRVHCRHQLLSLSLSPTSGTVDFFAPHTVSVPLTFSGCAATVNKLSGEGKRRETIFYNKNRGLVGRTFKDICTCNKTQQTFEFMAGDLMAGGRGATRMSARPWALHRRRGRRRREGGALRHRGQLALLLCTHLMCGRVDQSDVQILLLSMAWKRAREQ